MVDILYVYSTNSGDQFKNTEIRTLDQINGLYIIHNGNHMCFDGLDNHTDGLNLDNYTDPTANGVSIDTVRSLILVMKVMLLRKVIV